MTVTLKYDGKVLIPEGPLALPLNESMRVELTVMEQPRNSKEAKLAALDRLWSRGVTGLNISEESLRRENLYPDRA